MKLQEKLGREEALEFIKALDESLRELATKADLREEVAKLWEEMAKLRGEIARVEGQMAEVNARLSKVETYIKILIALFLIAIALYSPVFFELLKMLVKI